MVHASGDVFRSASYRFQEATIEVARPMGSGSLAFGNGEIRVVTDRACPLYRPVPRAPKCFERIWRTDLVGVPHEGSAGANEKIVVIW